VLETTGSAVQTGLTAFFNILPIVIAGFFGGTLVDRLGYKRMSIVADIASGITVAFVPILFSLGLLPFWLLLVLVFLSALLDAPGSTARSALIPELAEAANMPLERASSLLQIADRAARMIGAPLAGLLVALMGAQNVLWLDAATFAISALMIALLVPVSQTVRPTQKQEYRSELAEGLQFLRRDRLLMVIVGTVMITNFLDAAKGAVILPVYARDIYDSAVVLGLMFGLSGGGAVLGALVYGAIGHKYSRRWVFVGAFIAVSLPIFILATLPPLPVVLLVQLISGIAAGPINPVLSTVEYERIPPNMRGRVFGTITAGAWMAMPLGVLLGGFAIEGVGLVPTLLIVGSCYLITTVSLAFNPVLKLMVAPSPTSLTGRQ
jgi:MFS family permease